MTDHSHLSLSDTKRTYYVLMPDTVESRWGDMAYVELGFVEARTPKLAAREARRQFSLDDGVEIAVVASGLRTERTW